MSALEAELGGQLPEARATIRHAARRPPLGHLHTQRSDGLEAATSITPFSDGAVRVVSSQSNIVWWARPRPPAWVCSPAPSFSVRVIRVVEAPGKLAEMVLMGS